MLKVNFTRMELMRLQRRLSLARRGHKLLKDKEEQLLSLFYRLMQETQDLRAWMEKELLRLAGAYLQSHARYLRGHREQFFFPARAKAEVTVAEEQVFNLRVPRFTCQWPQDPPPAFNVMPLDLQGVVAGYRTLFEKLLRLKEMENRLTLFAREIEVTRRRVNSLEYILIPELVETTRAIEMRLEESERENFVRLRHIKQLSG